MIAALRFVLADHLSRRISSLDDLDPADDVVLMVEVHSEATYVRHHKAIYADGGLLGSKPYAAGGNYINRMSDFCRHCRYDVRQREGKDACPNYLYWDFMYRNRKKIGRNQRLSMVYRTLGRMAPERLKALRRHASDLLERLEPTGDWT